MANKTTNPDTYLVDGIANRKKSDIDAIKSQIEDAQFQVNQLQANVVSLTEKAGNYSLFLSTADNTKATALANLNMATDTVSSVSNLRKNAKTATKQTRQVCSGIEAINEKVSRLTDKLILTVELIDQVSTLAQKQKAQNPLIPDELISFLTKATSDANNAVAKTLTAVSSCYAAGATIAESKEITNLEFRQIKQLKKRIKHKSTKDNSSPNSVITKQGDASSGLYALLQKAYHDSVEMYNKLLKANNVVNKQLEYATAQLKTATTKLNSLNAGLAAAQAAAFAA